VRIESRVVRYLLIISWAQVAASAPAIQLRYL